MRNTNYRTLNMSRKLINEEKEKNKLQDRVYVKKTDKGGK